VEQLPNLTYVRLSGDYMETPILGVRPIRQVDVMNIHRKVPWIRYGDYLQSLSHVRVLKLPFVWLRNGTSIFTAIGSAGLVQLEQLYIKTSESMHLEEKSDVLMEDLDRMHNGCPKLSRFGLHLKRAWTCFWAFLQVLSRWHQLERLFLEADLTHIGPCTKKLVFPSLIKLSVTSPVALPADLHQGLAESKWPELVVLKVSSPLWPVRLLPSLCKNAPRQRSIRMTCESLDTRTCADLMGVLRDVHPHCRSVYLDIKQPPLLREFVCGLQRSFPNAYIQLHCSGDVHTCYGSDATRQLQ
jgi:hypothetical protein